MYKVCFFIFFCFGIIHCGGPASIQNDVIDNINTRGRGEPSGDTDHLETDIEEITDDPEGFAENVEKVFDDIIENISECESSTPGVNISNSDIAIEVVNQITGLSIPKPGGAIRECILQNVEEASTRICNSQRSIYDAYQSYSKGYDERSARITLAYENTLRTEDNYRNQLLKLADSFYDEADRGGVFENDWEVTANVLDQEGTLRCADRLQYLETMRNR